VITVGIISKLWKRPALTRAFLRYYSALQVPGMRFVLVAAASPDEDPHANMLMHEYWPDWYFVDAPNRPLSEKSNAACSAMASFSPDLIINVGSDDFLDPTYIRRVVRQVQAGADYVVPAELYFFDVPTGRCCHIWNNHGMKAGAAMSSRLLDAVDWNPWIAGDRPDSDIDDRIRTVRLDGQQVEPCRLFNSTGIVLDVKSGEGNLGSYDEARAYIFSRDVDGEHLLQHHFPGLLEELTHAGLTGVPVAP
jgi:hypothetical protein